MEVLWQSRNDRVHERKNSETERDNLRREIEKLKTTKMYIPPKLRKMYQQETSKILAPKSSLSDVRRWIRIFTKCQTLKYTHKKSRYRNTSDIRSHFNNTSPARPIRTRKRSASPENTNRKRRPSSKRKYSPRSHHSISVYYPPVKRPKLSIV